MRIWEFGLAAALGLAAASGTGSAQNRLSDRLMKTPIFSGCTPQEQVVLMKAEIAASAAVDGALAQLTTLLRDIRTLRTVPPIYVEWFGNYDYERFKRVHDIFAQIRIHTWVQQIHAHCEKMDDPAGKCKIPAKPDAYVFRNKAYDIALCPSYFTLTPAKVKQWGLSDSVLNYQAGVLIHELSHFDVNGHADDFDYTAADARKLAKEAPDTAVENADNYHYFATTFITDDTQASTPLTSRLAPADAKDQE